MKIITRTGLSLLLALFTLTAFAQKKTQSFQVKTIINAPADKVWAVVGEDFGAIAKSHPKIVSSNYINGTLKAGEGAERVCNYNESGSRYLHEKQIKYDPVNYSFEVEISHIAGLPLVAEYSRASYTVVPIDDTSSEFVFTMTYRTKPAFMGAMMKNRFKKTIGDYAIAIEHHILTGEDVNKDNFKSIKDQYGK